MGSTYSNAVVVGVTSEQVVSALGPAKAFVSPALKGVVVAFARDDEESPGAGLGARRISSTLDRPVLDVFVFDSDICSLQVLTNGEPRAAIVAPPEAMEEMDDDDGPVGMDPEVFAAEAVRALGRGDEGVLVTALTTDVVFAEEAHRAVLAALGLPVWPAGWGYRYLDQDQPELACGPLLRIP